jgi:hypothetical protein
MARRPRTHYRFTLGRAVEAVETTELLKLAAAQIRLGTAAMMDAERDKAFARFEAALELVTEARTRGDQLRLL